MLMDNSGEGGNSDDGGDATTRDDQINDISSA